MCGRPKTWPPSQCPGTARSVASAGRSEMCRIPGRRPRPVGLPGPGRATCCSPGPQVRGELVAQAAAGLHEQRPVERLVRDLQLPIIGELSLEPARDLLR